MQYFSRSFYRQAVSAYELILHRLAGARIGLVIISNQKATVQQPLRISMNDQSTNTLT
jgi:hypothetical protein